MFRLLSASGSLPPKLAERLMEELEDVSANFQTISCNFDIINFPNSSEDPFVSYRLGGYDDWHAWLT